MGSVYRRGDSEIWWLSYQVNGKRYRCSSGTTNRKRAEALLAKREAEVFEGTHFPQKRRQGLTMGQVRDRWLEHAARKKSVADDRIRLGRIVDVLGETTPVANLTTRDVERLVEALGETPRYPATEARKRGQKKHDPTETLSAASINRHLAVLRAALNLTKREGHVHQDPMAGFKLLKEHNERDRVCSPDELRQLAEAAPTDYLRLAVLLGYHTGMRLGEIVSLTWEQVDLRRRLVRLGSQHTKTGEARRVPLSAAAVEALKAEPCRLDGGSLFNVTRNTVSSAFSKLVRELGIEDLRFHDLRHTALTNLRRAGADVFVIAAISGHKDLKTLRRYQQVSDEDLHGAMARTDGLGGGDA